MGIKEKARDTALSIVLPYLMSLLVDIIADAFTYDGVIEFRGSIAEKMKAYAESTENQWDDIVIDVLLRQMLTLENFAEWGAGMVEIAESYVRHTETKWDDLCLPLLAMIKTILGGNDA